MLSVIVNASLKKLLATLGNKHAKLFCSGVIFSCALAVMTYFEAVL